jgi:hypothetical protein
VLLYVRGDAQALKGPNSPFWARGIVIVSGLSRGIGVIAPVPRPIDEIVEYTRLELFRCSRYAF